MDRILHMERLSRMGAQRCLQRDMRLLRVAPGGQTDTHLPRRELAAARVGRARAEMAPIPQSWGTQELAPLKGPCNWVARSSETHEWLGVLGLPVYLLCFNDRLRSAARACRTPPARDFCPCPLLLLRID